MLGIVSEYNRLWKLLIDKGMKKSDLRKVANASSSSLAKPGKGENVTIDVMLKICAALDCCVEDIMEIVKDEDQSDRIARGISPFLEHIFLYYFSITEVDCKSVKIRRTIQ